MWAVSVLISSVTFKLSLEAAAAADHVRRALGCWGRISSAGSQGRGRRALITWLSCTEYVAEHALFTWLITHLSRDITCTDHVALMH